MIAQLDLSYICSNPTKLFSRLLSYFLFEGRPITTKGRWINPIVFGHFAFLKHLPRFKQVKNPIFIIGTGRSGTTILGKVLSLHPDVGFLNEPKALWHSIYPREDVIGNYTQGKAYFRLLEKDADEEIILTAHKLFGAYLAFSCSKRLVDKYPELVFRISFVKKIFPDAKFLFMTRNGWNACYSIKGWSSRKGKRRKKEIHDWWGINSRKWILMIDQLVNKDPYFYQIKDKIKSLSTHKDRAVIEWILTNREGLKKLKQYPDDILMIRYEDLIKDTKNVLLRLLRFCSLTPDKRTTFYADKVLKEEKSHPSFSIDPDILPLFNDTMTRLGY